MMLENNINHIRKNIRLPDLETVESYLGYLKDNESA